MTVHPAFLVSNSGVKHKAVPVLGGRYYRPWCRSNPLHGYTYSIGGSVKFDRECSRCFPKAVLDDQPVDVRVELHSGLFVPLGSVA